MKFEEIYFGFDLGTKNIGYAVTDADYRLLRIDKKRAIGVRFFDEAKTAMDRRVYRCARTRLKRRKYRISLLQEIFDEELMKKDPNFLRKLNENDLKTEDSFDSGLKYSLFNDRAFNDKVYYKKYPTIYHLRKALCEGSTDDIRLLYLAIHHIIKYRGNFLFNGNMDDCRNPLPIFEELNEYLYSRHTALNMPDDDLFGQKINDIEQLDTDGINNFGKLITDKLSKKDKKIKAHELFQATATQKPLLDTIFGGSVNITKLFGADKYPKDTFRDFRFSDDFEQIEASLSSVTDETDFNIILCLKKLYDFQTLIGLLNDKDSLSGAMVDIYNQHKSDLKNLKYIIGKYAADKYSLMFDEPSVTQKDIPELDKKNNNYSKYIGGGVYNGVKLGKCYDDDGRLIADKTKVSRNGRLGKTCTQEEFYKTVKAVLLKLKVDTADEEIYKNILLRIEDGIFMPKIVSKANSALPYQLNMQELDKILKNAVNSGNYPFLQKIEDGYSVCDKIKLLLQFRIPYYVGHVKEYREGGNCSKNSWAVRKQSGRVTPWNFEDMIDIEKSKVEFIQRMTTNCTYLKNQKTLPKNSVLFGKFVALNELNKLKINGEPINVELKKSIYNDVYLNKKVNKENIIQSVKRLTGVSDIILTGIDEAMHGDMDVYRKFKRILSDKVDRYPDMIEKLIFLMTIYADDANIIFNAVCDEFVKNKKILTLDEAKKLRGIKFKGWSALSQGLLAGSTMGKNEGLILTDELGQKKDIIEILYDTNLNFMQIINDKRFNFKEALNEYNIANGIVENNEITYGDIDELYCSPSVKKIVWQTYEMTKELVKITKSIPSKVFLEVTRSNDDRDKKAKKRTKSRKEIIDAAYQEAINIVKQNKKSIKDKIDSNIEDIASYKNMLQDTNNNSLNSEKLFLYFMQLGRCAYSNKPIDLDRLKDYDIDHIIPQSKVKDDSLNNKILVEGKLNKEKGDTYPVLPKFRTNAKSLWDTLLKLKLMTDDKYSRLVRQKPISSEEQEKFINRQLIETAQSVLSARDILARYFKGLCNQYNIDKEVEIVLSKAGNVSDFRKSFGLTKSREINDFHHACDAYLNIVVGNGLNEKFSHNKDYRENIDSEHSKSYNFKKAFESNIYSYREKRVIFYPQSGPDSTLSVINKELSIPNYNVSKKIVSGKGELYKATIFKAGVGLDDDVLYSRVEKFDKDGMYNPKSDTSKYGGFKHSGTAYFLIIDSKDRKGNTVRSVEAVPIYYAKKISQKKLSTEAFLSDVLKLNNPKPAVIEGLKSSKLLVGSLLEFEQYTGEKEQKTITFRLRLSGKTAERLTFHNANELIADKATNDYVKELSLTMDKINKAFIKNISIYKDMDKEKIRPEIYDELKNEKIRRINTENQMSNIIMLSKEQNLCLYDLFIKKVTDSNSPYTYLPSYNCFAATLTKSRDCFAEMDEYAQLSVLLKIIKAFQCNPDMADTSNLNYIEKGKSISGKKNQCKITFSNKIYEVKKKASDNKFKRIDFISQSVTGLKEKRIKISYGV